MHTALGVSLPDSLAIARQDANFDPRPPWTLAFPGAHQTEVGCCELGPPREAWVQPQGQQRGAACLKDFPGTRRRALELVDVFNGLGVTVRARGPE